jgi:GNAT superfamily N-acetyltransferase
MDVRMPDGTIVTGVPDGITQTELLARYKKYTPNQPAEIERPSLGSPMGEDFGSSIMAAAEPAKPRPVVQPVPKPLFGAPAMDAMGNVIGEGIEEQVGNQGPASFDLIKDLAKQFAAPIAAAPFQIPKGAELGLKGLARQSMEGNPENLMPASVYQPGLDTEETLFGKETPQQMAQRKLQAQRAVASTPSIPYAEDLSAFGQKVQKSIQNSLSEEGKKSLQNSAITGNIFKGEIDFGKDPTVRGYALQIANVLGSTAPSLLTSIVTKSPALGGAVGGTMAADEAGQNAAQYIGKMSDADLMQNSPFFAEMVAGGSSPKEARALAVKKAAESGAALQGMVATFGDTLTGKLVTGAFDDIIRKVAGSTKVGRAVGTGTLAGLEESMQETGEGIGSDIGIKSVIKSKEIGEDSAANAVLGFLGGVGPGGVRGLITSDETPKGKPIPSAEQMMRDRGFLISEQKAKSKAAPSLVDLLKPTEEPTNEKQQKVRELEQKILALGGEKQKGVPDIEQEAEAPTALTPVQVAKQSLTERIGLPEGPARPDAANEKLDIDDAILLRNMMVKIVDDGLASGKTRQQISQQLESLTQGGIRESDFSRIHDYMTERGVKEAPVAEAKPTESAQDKLEAKVQAVTNEVGSPVKQRYDKLVGRQGAMQSAKRDGLITNEEYSEFTAQLKQARVAYEAEQLNSKELTPQQQEGFVLADQLEAAGLANFAAGMRLRVARELNPDLTFARQKLQEVTKVKEQAQNEGIAEKQSLDNFYDQPNSRTNSPKFLADYRAKAPQKIRMMTDKAESLMQQLVARINAAGFKVADVNSAVGASLRPYKKMLMELSGSASGVVGREAGIRKKYKNSNPQSFKTAQQSLLRDIDSAQQLLDEEIVFPDQDVFANTPMPDRPEVEELLEKSRLASADVDTLSRRTAGGSLMKVLEGSLRDGEMSELSGKARQVGKNPFISLVAKKPKPGSSMEDIVESGLLDKFLPPKMRTGSPTYDNQESAAHIREKLMQGQYYTYDTQIEIDRVQEGVWDIDKLIQEELLIDDINKEIQLAFDEQREADLATEEAIPEGEVRSVAEGEGAKAESDFLTAQTGEELKAKQDEVERLQKENDRLAKEAERKAKADEQANDFVLTGSNREADQAAARGQRDIFAEAPAEEAPVKEVKPEKGVVATPDGAKLRYPVALAMVNNGYQVLALDSPRTYVDKGGTPHRTFEKGPLRIAMTPQRTLFQNRNVVNTGIGESNEMILEAVLVDPAKRNQGLATQAMQDVTDAADKNGVTLYAEPAPIVNIKNKEFGLDRDQLTDFYGKFGFDFLPDSNRVMQREPNAEVEVLPAEEPAPAAQIENEPYTFEGEFTEIGEEEQRMLITDQTSKLSDTQITSLEQQYGAQRDSDQFFDAVRKDVIAYVTKGAAAVHGKIRAIIRQLANGLLSVAVVFNPQFVSKPYTIAVPQYETRTSEVVQALPKEAQSMSDAAKRAYGVIYPTLEGELKEKDKLFIIADKQSGNTYMFLPDGSLLKQSKTLFGAGIGDFMKGDNEIVANRITPAGLFDLGLRDAQRSEGEARTAGEYDFGKVFVLSDAYMGRSGPFSQTIMHSVWTHEKDAKQRLAALDKPGAEDSRYSFGCINLNKEEFRYMITNHLGQMDGAKIFIVPENGTNVMDFVNGKATYSDDIIRKSAEPKTKTTTTETQRAAPSRQERTMAAKEEEGPTYFSIEKPNSIEINGKNIPVTMHRLEKGNQIVKVDSKAFDNAFSKTAWQYIGENGKGGIGDRYKNFAEFIKTAKSIDAPNVAVNKDGGIVFGDGRHRYAYLRDMGVKNIPLSMDAESIKNAKKFGYISEQVNMNLGDSLVKLVDQMADELAEDQKKRSPSLIRKLKTLNRQRKEGRLTDEEYAQMSNEAIEEDYENAFLIPAAPRKRGYLLIQEKMSAAVRRGELSREAYDLANWFMLQNEALVDDLGISIKGKGPLGVGGFYNNLSRIITLIKEGSSDLTATHEILHHLERMMPPKIQQAIRKAWLSQLTKAQKTAKSPAAKLYFAALMDAHFGANDPTLLNIPEGAGNEYAAARSNMEDSGKKTSMELAKQLLLLEFVPIEAYQFFDPSEFWAVNGTDIVQARYDAVKGGTLSKLANWLRELGQKIKSLFGLKSDASIIRALDSLSKSDGMFVTEDMLSKGDVYASVEKPSEPTPADKEKDTWLLGKDKMGNVGFGPGAKAYSTISTITNNVLDKIAMKPISPELGRAMRNMKAKVNATKNKVAEVASDMNALSPEEREMISDVIEGELKAGVHPPQHVLNIAAAIQSVMTRQSKELVDLGMLSKEAANRWDNKYLPRFYETQLRDTVTAWSKAAKEVFMKQPLMRGIRGSNLRSRGMYEVINTEDLPDWIDQGWEQRDASFDPKKSQETVVWRDYTRKEREDMGEIRDAMFRFVMGYNASQRDIALGRLYKDLAKNYASKMPLDDYVQVPTGKAEGTGAPRYGALEGLYVPREIMDHLSANDHAMADGLLKIYRAGLSKWKEGKTVLNPVSHANNVISNVTMAHFAGVSYWDAHKYAGAIKDLAKNGAMVKEADEVGLFGGTFSQSDLIKSMPPELRQMANMTDSALSRFGERIWDTLAFTVEVGGKKYGARPIMQWAYENEDLFFRYVIYRDARNRGMNPEDARDYSQEFIFTYDDLPKGARLLRDYGMPFFSYTYKVVPVLARTALKYPWRYAAPATIAYTVNAMMYAIAANLGGDDDDWWGKVLYKYVTDEEFRKKAKDLEANERRLLPEWMKGHSAILSTPKAIRMGVDEATNMPMFLDISRIFPGGDLLDANNNSGGVAMIQPLTPSNPVLTSLVAMMGNKDLFLGKDITSSTDTDTEKAAKRASWLWKQITPAIAVGNYHFDRAMNAMANMTGKPITVDAGPMGVIGYTGIGKDGLPVQPKHAMLQTMGIKIRPYDLEMAEVFEQSNKRQLVREIDFAISKINRNRGVLSSEAAEIERDKLFAKKANIKQGLTLTGEEKK